MSEQDTFLSTSVRITNLADLVRNLLFAFQSTLHTVGKSYSPCITAGRSVPFSDSTGASQTLPEFISPIYMAYEGAIGDSSRGRLCGIVGGQPSSMSVSRNPRIQGRCIHLYIDTASFVRSSSKKKDGRRILEHESL